MIHTCNTRLDYVLNHLFPSLVKQRIKISDIEIHVDDYGDGNLKSTLKSFKQLPEDGATWHLQDDVIISSDFKKRTEDIAKKHAAACGFCSVYDSGVSVGIVNPDLMWYSFPCILIPNKWAHEFVDWVQQQNDDNNGKYWLQITNNMFDDYLFKSFMTEKHPDAAVLNIVPNLVNNIDYLIGGSILSERKEKIHAIYWEEPELIKELENKLKG